MNHLRGKELNEEPVIRKMGKQASETYQGRYMILEL